MKRQKSNTETTLHQARWHWLRGTVLASALLLHTGNVGAETAETIAIDLPYPSVLYAAKPRSPFENPTPPSPLTLPAIETSTSAPPQPAPAAALPVADPASEALPSPSALYNEKPRSPFEASTIPAQPEAAHASPANTSTQAQILQAPDTQTTISLETTADSTTSETLPTASVLYATKPAPPQKPDAPFFAFPEWGQAAANKDTAASIPAADTIAISATTAKRESSTKPSAMSELPAQTYALPTPPASAPASAASSAAATPAKPATQGYSALGEFLTTQGGIIRLSGGENAPANIQEPVTIDEAVAFALKNNLEVQASASAVKSSSLEKGQAYSRLAPALDVKLSKGDETSSPSSYNDSFGDRVLHDAHTRKDRSVSLRQPLIDLEVIADIVTSKSKESLAKDQDREQRESIAQETANSYLKLLQSSISVQLAEGYRDYLNTLSQRMEGRVSGGAATVGDLEKIRSQATMAEAARVEALGEYQSNLAEFRRITQVTPAQFWIGKDLTLSIPDSADEALEQALKHNPGYIASQSKIAVASAVREGSLAKATPKLSLEYSDNYSYNAGGAAKGNPVDGVYPSQEDKRLLLVAHWALNGGMEVMAGLAAREKENEAKLRSLDVRSRLEEGMRASYNALHASDQRIELLQKTVASNQKVVDAYEDQYANGSRSLFELLDAHQQLYSSRLNMMRVEIAKAMASYQIHRQMGSLLNALIQKERERT